MLIEFNLIDILKQAIVASRADIKPLGDYKNAWLHRMFVKSYLGEKNRWTPCPILHTPVAMLSIILLKLFVINA